MRVGITGETGYLAYHLKQRFLAEGHQVIELTRDYISNLDKVKDCDTLIHCAAVSRASSDDEVYDANVRLAKELVAKLDQLSIRINVKYISSIQENSDTAYGRAKLEGKRIVESYCIAADTTFESYALPNTFGPFSKPNHNMFVSTFCYNIVNNLPCSYNNNPINLCWVDDAVDVILNKTTEYKLHHTSVNQVYEIIKGVHEGSCEESELANRLAQVYRYFKNQSKTVFVLGHRGMLGWITREYLRSLGYTIHTTDSRFPSEQFIEEVKSFKGDYIINCIGAIPQKTDKFSINEDLPIWLSDNATQCKVVHPGTDCEIDDDAYGTSKRKATQYIQSRSNNTKVLKTSIIGPELVGSFSLMDWFLSQKTKVSGYTKAMWNGNTTLEWAKYARMLIDDWDQYETVTILRGETVSKYELLTLMKEAFHKDVEIEPVPLGKSKCLTGGIPTKSLREQLLDLKNFLMLQKTTKYNV
jgi:nucleoside-diphosphate-sugar epimerase